MPSGMTGCKCRDCMELTVSDDSDHPDFCFECIDAGCPDYQGVEGMSQECQRPDAYGSPDCPTCEKPDAMYYDDGDWHCGACSWDQVFQGAQPGWTRVKIYPNGAALVHTGTSYCVWPKDAVKRSIGAAKTCCESRRVYWPEGTEQCPCLACHVAKAHMNHENRSDHAKPMEG